MEVMVKNVFSGEHGLRALSYTWRNVESVVFASFSLTQLSFSRPVLH